MFSIVLYLADTCDCCSHGDTCGTLRHKGTSHLNLLSASVGTSFSIGATPMHQLESTSASICIHSALQDRLRIGSYTRCPCLGGRPRRCRCANYIIKAAYKRSCGHLLLCEFHACIADSTDVEQLSSDISSIDGADCKCFDLELFDLCTVRQSRRDSRTQDEGTVHDRFRLGRRRRDVLQCYQTGRPSFRDCS
jgi:hypothetical protein